MSLRLNNILSILGLIFLCVLCFIIGRLEGDTKVFTEIRWDTITIEKPVPYKVETVRTEYVYVHTPADTVVIERVDSVLVAVDIERRVYGDERYRAVVSGAVVGDIHPTLESIDVYTSKETKIIEPKQPLFKPYIRGSIGRGFIGFGGGVSIRDKIDADVQYVRAGDKGFIVTGINYKFNIQK